MRAELNIMARRVAAAITLALFAVAVSPMQRAAAQGAPDLAPALHDMRWKPTFFVLSEVLEIAPRGGGQPVLFDLVGWVGGATRRIWTKADRSTATTDGTAHGEYQILYGAQISPFFDVQLGVRADVVNEAGGSESRYGAVVGVQGLAPGMFEVEPSLFFSSDGNVTLDLTASYDLFFTQRLVVQPRLEMSAALQDSRRLNVGAGLGSTALALRARYEVRREFAPYVGVLWERRFGATADLNRLAGRAVGEAMFVAGVRLWR